MSKKKKIILPELPAGITLFDTHCHLDMMPPEDVDLIVSEAGQAGITQILTIGIDLTSSARAIEIAGGHKGVYASVGIHPHNVSGVTEHDYGLLRALAKNEQVVAYGEIGLDFVKTYSPIAEQLDHYQRQIQLAKELDLPLIIHDREAHGEIMSALRRAAPFPSGGVMHCFSGDYALAKEVLDLGFLLSIPGIVTYKNAEMLQEVARRIPLTSLLLETDAPFLAPIPVRGRQNKSSYVLFTAEKIAGLRGILLGDIAMATTENSRKLFRLHQHKA